MVAAAHVLTVDEVVLANPTSAGVLVEHGIDVPCREHVGLEEACRRRGIDYQLLGSALHYPAPPRPGEVNLRAMSAPALVQHLVRHHHLWLRRSLPASVALAEHVAAGHADKDKRLKKLLPVLQTLARDLLAHLDHEEMDVLPALLARDRPAAALRGMVDGMAREHAALERQLAQVRELTDNLVAPSWACASHRALLAQLDRVEQDLVVHVQAEMLELVPRLPATDARKT